jgi:hypothetical protein
MGLIPYLSSFNFDPINFLNMNKQFVNNAGFAWVQSSVINLSDTDLAEEVAEIRRDPIGWVDRRFTLTVAQRQQLGDLPPAFLQSIADALADAWSRRELVLFNKEEQPILAEKQDDRSLKDYIFERAQTQSYAIDTETLHNQETVSIQIRYRII